MRRYMFTPKEEQKAHYESMRNLERGLSSSSTSSHLDERRPTLSLFGFSDYDSSESSPRILSPTSSESMSPRNFDYSTTYYSAGRSTPI